VELKGRNCLLRDELKLPDHKERCCPAEGAGGRMRDALNPIRQGWRIA